MSNANHPDHLNESPAVMEAWEEFLKERYPEEQAQHAALFQAVNPNKTREQFRNYEVNARPTVREFYRQNHRYQTLDFVRAKKKEYLPLNRRTMGVWEAMEFLNTLVDDSDPDTDLSQLEHLLQVAEAIRRDGHPRWFILTGLIHDLGKILCLYGEPSGRSWVTLFLSAAGTRKRWCSTTFSKKTPTGMCRNTRPSQAFMSWAAGWIRFISRGDMMSISIMWSRITCRKRRSI